MQCSRPRPRNRDLLEVTSKPLDATGAALPAGPVYGQEQTSMGRQARLVSSIGTAQLSVRP